MTFRSNFPSLPLFLQTALLLTLSNVFITFAWYGHLKNLSDRAWWIAALISWVRYISRFAKSGVILRSLST